MKVKKNRKHEKFISFQTNMEQLTNCKNYNLNEEKHEKDAFKTIRKKRKQNISLLFL